MKSFVGFGLQALLVVMVVGGAIMGIYTVSWTNSVYYTWQTTAVALIDNVATIISDNIRFVEFAAKSVPDIVANADTTPLPRLLSEMFSAFDQKSNYSFGSFGYMQFNGTAKTSWQVAKGYGCPDYMYAYSDSIIWPNFTGYCVNQSGIYLDNIPDYTGTDWGPRPLERALFAGNITATFLPIETLIGMPTFTYEEYDNGAVVFAEMNLTTLSADIASKAPTDFSFLHVSETQSKLLIATTDPLGVLYSNGTRRTLPTINGGIVLTHRIAYLNNSLDWTVYVGTTYDKVYGNLRYVTMVAGIVGMVIVLVGVGALVFSIWFCVSRVLHNPNSYSLFSDIQPGAGVVMDV